ncbi:protein FAM50 [Geosmithia morbida]|uniref:Protein FAM50 n=1 Tax=Geosmithia morbida TaxID=1094350 RepID=A0A9P5D6D1_9HYPO|nr:protein FAM50 [Geosmithia morbida]KAF4125491.1 protein FAM50 [Geosmithia morbida]
MANVDTSLPPEPSGAASQLASKHSAEHPLKLYGGWFCPFVQRSWITLVEKGIPHQYIEINPYLKEASFLALNPRGLVPTLGVPAPDGSQRALYESNIVCEYLDEEYSDESQYGPPLLPRDDAYARARARLWIDHVGSRIIPAFYRLLQHTPDKDYTLDQARATLHEHILTFVRQMDEGTWFLGDSFSLVDVVLAPWAKRLWLIDHYKPGGTGIPDGTASKEWARWKVWYDAIVQRPSVRDTWSDDERYLISYKRSGASAPWHRSSSTMSEDRFTPQNKSTHERLTTNTVGLVAFSDFRKRRAQVIEEQERESRGAASATATTTASAATSDTEAKESSANPPNKKAKTAANSKKNVENRTEKKKKKNLLSFDDEDDNDDAKPTPNDDNDGDKSQKIDEKKEASAGTSKFKPNASVDLVPKPMTKAALRREAAEREALRKEFLALKEAVKATEIAIPFVFYDGTNIPGGIVRLKKGDFSWLFLDKSRKVGAQLGVGEKRIANARKNWARVGVDDLMLVRGTIIIPHHYDFYYFIVNKSLGPDGHRIFGYSNQAPEKPTPLGGALAPNDLPDITTLEGADDDPTLTKVVDRRWYQRNKHIYPASTWQEFEAEKDYMSEVRRDTGGNTFFFSG